MTDDRGMGCSASTPYGEELSRAEMLEWYRDEMEGYSALVSAVGPYSYVYHELNRYLGFRHIQIPISAVVLGVGSATGEELLPIAERIGTLKVMEPSEKLQVESLGECASVQYVKPIPLQPFPFEDEFFDLITCFGVLHHVPDVRRHIHECWRVLKPGGAFLLREPIVSMGDWRVPRRGLTKRERGIPLEWLDKVVAEQGFCVDRRSLCNVNWLARCVKKVGVVPYSSRLFVRADACISRWWPWSIVYHRTKWHHKLAPASVFYVLTKRDEAA